VDNFKLKETCGGTWIFLIFARRLIQKATVISDGFFCFQNYCFFPSVVKLFFLLIIFFFSYCW
jgi:hypothetical protein